MPSYLIILAVFAALALLGRRVEGSWIAPATIWPIAWGSYAAGALAYVGEAQRIVPALLWILLSCTVFLAGAVVSRIVAPAAPLRVVSPAPSERFPWLGRITLALSAAGFLAVLSEIRATGFGLADLLSFATLTRLAAASRAAFTFGEQEQGLVARLLLVLAYTGPLFGGVYLVSARRWRERVLGLAPLVAVTLVGFVHGSRMGVLFGGSFWLAAYLSGRLLSTSGDRRAATRLFAVVAAFALVLFVGLSTAVQYARYFVGNQKTTALIIADPFGFVPAFAQWFDASGFKGSDLSAGFYSFERLGRMLGLDRPAFPSVDVGFTTSNVYTVFRALIEDFGSLGSLVVVGAVGLLGSWSYRRVVAGRSTWVAALSLTYAFIFTSMALSPFSYTGPAFGATVFTCYVTLAARPRGSWAAILNGLSPLPGQWSRG
jgi:oligosaccharide repeat unit polymerase